MKSNRQSGFSLIEVLVAATILSVGLVAVLTLIRLQTREADALAARRRALADVRIQLIQMEPTEVYRVPPTAGADETNSAENPSGELSSSPRVLDDGPWLPAASYSGGELPLTSLALEQAWSGGGRAGVVAIPFIGPVAETR